MEEVLRNSEGNDSFFYIFMIALVILAIGSNVFKKNLSYIFSSDHGIIVDNSILFIFFGILFFSISGGLFLNSVNFEQLNYRWLVEVNKTNLIDNIIIYSFLCFAVIVIRFSLSIITIFIFNLKIKLQIYFLLRLRHIIILSFILIVLAIIIRYIDINRQELYILLKIISTIALFGFIFLIIKKLIYLNHHTEILYYYIILYLCILEILPILVVGKLLIISS